MLLKLAALGVLTTIAMIASSATTLYAFPSFSLAPGSPSAGALPPGSVLDPVTGAPTPGGPQPPPVVAFTNAALGIPATGNVQDISYGDDQVIFSGFGGGTLFFHFAVAPGAMGGPWLPPVPAQNVFTQGTAGEGHAESDIYKTAAAVMPPPFGALGCGLGGNTQLYDANGINVAGPPVPGLGGLVDPGPGPVGVADAIDAYEFLGPKAVDYQKKLKAPLSGPDGVPDAPVFFTVDPATAGGMGVSAADVLVTDPNSPLGWSVYAPAGALGLVPGDDIDALMVADSATSGGGLGSIVAPARTFSPATPWDFVAFSLAPGSPSLGGGPLPAVCSAGIKTPGDVWAVSPFLGGPFPLASAESLGLCSVRVGCAANDDLVAMDIQWSADADKDGAPDPLEGACGAAVGPSDTDGDGLPDSIEMTLSSNPAGVCAGLPKSGTADSDFDGMPDGWEIAYWSPSCLATNASVPDPGTDTDGDGVPNIGEMLQFTSPCNADSDGDGFKDLQSTSQQGPANTVATTDNCPNVANPSQANADGNFIGLSAYGKGYDDKTQVNSDQLGDACDSDADNDGLANTDELALGPGHASHALCSSASADTDPFKIDSDGDRFTDGAECALGTDPMNALSKPTAATCASHLGVAVTTDTDGDGVKDYVEFCYYGSSPASTNTDGDPCTDGKEVASINGDTLVNATDLQQVALAFGNSTQPQYIPDFDMDKNGLINATDLQFVASKFGACP